MHGCVAIQSSVCSQLEREKAELTLSAVPAGDIRSRQTVASLLQQLQKQQQVNVSIVKLFLCQNDMLFVLYHINIENTIN